MDAQMKRGLTEALVLAILNGGDSYGYRLSRQAGEIMPLSESTLYPVLKRLEEAGAVGTYSREHGGRLRHYYRITEKGREQMLLFAREWEELGKVYELVRKAETEGAPEAREGEETA